MSTIPPLDTPTPQGYHFKQCGWLPHDLNPNQLLSLLEMLQVSANEYINIGVALQSISDNLTVNLAPEEVLAESARARITLELGLIQACCLRLNLAVCGEIAQKFHKAYEKDAPTFHRAKDDAHTLKLVLDAELQSRTFFFVPPERSGYYTDQSLEWLRPGFTGKMKPFQAVVAAFPSMEYDLQEAGNCFALGRWTASVFHLMRVMEASLKVVAKALGVAYSSNWGRCLAEIEKQGQQSEPFFAEAIAYLRSVKNAWRNPTMHVVRQYSEEEAGRIFNAVQGFMQHLASRLTE
jgi:hypothetical protein